MGPQAGPELVATRGQAWFMVVVLVAAVLAGLWFAFSSPGASLDGLFFDQAAPSLGQSEKAPGITVVLITEEDYSRAATPLALWGLHLTPFLEKMQTARIQALGLDLLLPRFALATWVESHDQQLFRALKKLSQTCRVVSGVGITPGGAVKEPYLVYKRILGENRFGFFNLDKDPDGVMRGQTLALATQGGKVLNAFATLLAGKRAAPGQRIMPDWRSPAQFQTLTYAQALKAPDTAFAGRTVLLGADFAFEDRHRTPAAPRGEPGVIIQARLVDALARGRSLLDLGWLPTRLLPALALVLAFLLFTQGAAQPRVLLVLVLSLAALAAVCLAALGMGLVLYPAAGALGLVLAAGARVGQGYVRMAQERQHSFASFIETLSAAVDARHRLTAGHSRRVTAYAQIIGQELNLGRDQLEPLKYAALLHDIGKIGVPDRVLLKDGRFDDEERAIMNQHTAQTQEILSHVYFPPDLAQVPELAGAHHERVDGRGYHSGLEQGDIPLLARIMAVADVFDALTSPRDYPKYDGGETMSRAPMPLKKAVGIILGDAGTAFDHDVVEAFRRCLPRILESERGAHFPEEYLQAYWQESSPAGADT